MASENLQKSTNREVVPIAHYEMMYWRFMGLDYKAIAAKTGYAYQTIRLYFSKGGLLNELYTEWLKNAETESKDQVLQMMWGHLPDIVRSRIVAAKGFGAPANTAAEIILRYTLGNPDGPMIQNNIQINDNRITGFNYIVPEKPNDTNNQTDVETAPSVPGVERPNN